MTIIDSLITGNKHLIPKKADFFNWDIYDQKEVLKIINQKIIWSFLLKNLTKLYLNIFFLNLKKTF